MIQKPMIQNIPRCKDPAGTLAAEEESKMPFCQMMAKMHEEKAAKGSGDIWSDKDGNTLWLATEERKVRRVATLLQRRLVAHSIHKDGLLHTSKYRNV